MPRFALLIGKATFRGQEFEVRQMTAGEKIRWAGAVKADQSSTLALAVQMCAKLDPPMTLAELALEPTGFVEALAEKIFELNGEDEPEKKGSPASS